MARWPRSCNNRRVVPFRVTCSRVGLVSALAPVVPALALVACSSSDGDGSGAAGPGGAGPACPLVGQADSEMVVRAAMHDVDGAIRLLEDGDSVPLLLPPQGGRVLLVGVEAEHLVPCGVRLEATIRDPDGGAERTDTRLVDLMADGARARSVDGDATTVSHVPMCPNQWTDGDLYGRPLELTISVTDAEGRTGATSLSVVPECAEPEHEAECTCFCSAGYEPSAGCGGSGGQSGT